MSYGLPGDCDPRDNEPEFECDCGDILMQDMFGDWFCPTCTDKDKQEETK